MTTADWWLVGNAATVNAIAQDAGSGPTAAAYDDWQIYVSKLGVATFFRNGAQVGVQMVGAITPATLVRP